MIGNKGSVTTLTLVYTISLLTVATSLTAIIVQSIKSSRNLLDQSLAIQAAEAGAEKAIWQINSGNDNNLALQKVNEEIKSEFEATIDTSTPGARKITVTGYSPTKATYRSKKTIKVTARASNEAMNIAFSYAAQAGDLGIIMANNTTIQGASGAGNASSNGSILGAGNSNRCTTCVIKGNAEYFDSISPDVTVSGNKSKMSQKKPLPDIDYDYWIGIADDTTDPSKTISTGNYIVNGSKDLGPGTIHGNFNITSGSTVNLQGTVHVTGDMIIESSNVTINLDDVFAGTGTAIIVDGKISVGRNTRVNKSSSGGYVILASRSTRSTTSDPAIILNNDVDNVATMAGGIYYALEGMIAVKNNAHPIEVVGKGIFLDENGELRYDKGIESATFEGAPGGGWVVSSWQSLN